MATVHHPDADYTGTATIGRRTLAFESGRAVLNGPASSWRRAGYRVSADEQPDLLADKTVPELRAHAAAVGVDLTGLSRKDEIVQAITAGAGAHDQDS